MATTVLRPQWVAVPGEFGPVAREGFDVAIQDDRIVAVGERLAKGDRTVDAPGCLLYPGMINAHTHIGASPLARGYLEDLDFTGLPFYMAVTPMSSILYEDEFGEELRALMTSDLLALLRSGVTTIVNQNGKDAGHLLGLLIETGMRAYSGPNLPSATTARGTVDAQGNVVRIPSPAEAIAIDLENVIALHEKYDQGSDGRVRVICGPASAEICGDEALLAMAKLNADWNVPLTLHLAQSEHDVRQSFQMFGKTSAAHLAELGLLGPNLIAAHSSLLSDDDVILFRDSGATVAHCASRKAKEGVFGPFQRYVDAGVRVALGNDAFTLDFVEEVRLAAMFGKLATGATRRPAAANALAAATEAGADAVGRNDLGRIEVGAKADVALVDLTGPFVAPVRDPIMSFIYYGSGKDIRSVWIDGQPVVADGVCVALDEADVMRKANEAAGRAWRAAKDRGILK